VPRASTHQSSLPALSRASYCQKNTTTKKFANCTKLLVRGAGEETLQDRDTRPDCTLRQAAATGGVPAKCLFQSSLPCDIVPCLNFNSAVPETATILCPGGAGKFPQQGVSSVQQGVSIKYMLHMIQGHQQEGAAAQVHFGVQKEVPGKHHTCPGVLLQAF